VIDRLVCKGADSLIHVMKIINNNAFGIAFVVDQDNKLCGTVTDGDIRRALLRDVELDEQVCKIISADYVFGLHGESIDSLINKINNKVKIIPLVDDEHRVVSYFEYNHSVNFPVAIPNLNGNELKYLMDAFLSSWISSSGEYITKFESSFSQYCDCEYGVAVSNGTVALHLALLALGVGEGDEVIVPDLTFAATINAVLHAKATPVIVDVELDSWCIDPKQIEKAVTAKTKAIIPVHIYGQPCDMNAVMAIAKKHNLFVVEDCAEAHGATYAGKKVGSIGDIGCFSFFGNKVITTGEGGMCVSNNKALDEKMRVLRDHGMSKSKRYWHDVVGYNYRLTNLQAAIGLAQLERIGEIHKNREFYEKTYRDVFLENDRVFMQRNDLPDRKKITWLVSILLDESLDRDQYILALKQKGVDARPFFYPLSDMAIYTEFCAENSVNAKLLSRCGLNLPTYESLKSAEELKEILIKN